MTCYFSKRLPPEAAFLARRLRGFLYLVLGAVLLLLFYLVLNQKAIGFAAYLRADHIPHAIPLPKPNTPLNYLPRVKELVLAAKLDSKMSWVEESLPGWRANIYRVDALANEAPLTVPVNKGNEAMPYLTYVFVIYLSFSLFSCCTYIEHSIS